MSEIRRDVPEGAGAGAEGKGAESHVGSRAARRRRMEIRRHRLVAERGAEEVSRKRRKLDEESSSTDEEEIEPAKYGVTSVCGRRRDMEDAVSIRPEFLPGHHFFGVFDGHGCSHVATSCGERMHEIVVEEAGGARSSGSDDADRWMGVMERSFARMDAEAVSSRSRASGAPTCRCELQLPKCDHVGSTAVVAVVGPRHLVVANCGDSRAVIGRGGAAIPLSSDHKPDRPDELERIQAAGGRVIFWDGARVFGVLAMSRAIGDSYLKPFVIPDPEVRVLERKDGDDEFLILASDGLWDVVSNEVACHVVRSCVRSKAKRRGGRSSPTSNLSPRQSSGSGSGSGSSSGDEAQNDGGGCADARSESDEESGEEVDEACAEAAILLTKLAIARQSSDNVSVVVVNLRRRRPRF